jgi:hypothetical protein
MSITLMIFYLFIRLIKCLIDSGISHGACKLTRISRIILKKKNEVIYHNFGHNHALKYLYRTNPIN